MISFIMMAKNVEKYIEESISELQKETIIVWELIVVEDHSDDNTYATIEALSFKDKRIKLYKNPYKGKVQGTNFGFEKTSGDIIKCIDSDDVLCLSFFDYLPEMIKKDAHIHSGYITDYDLNIIHEYHPHPLLVNGSFKKVCKELISPPKWSWSFKRTIGNKIFPIPPDLPFEDVWISLMIKKHSKSIYKINSACYLYRQHSSQTFGGIMSFKPEIRMFRANRLINLISILKHESRLMDDLPENIFDDAVKLNNVLRQKKPNLFSVIKVSNSLKFLTKNIIIIYFDRIASRVLSLKWKLDKYI